MSVSQTAAGSSSLERDRTFYFGVAILFAIVAVVSFAPTSYSLVADVVAGEIAPPPLVMHVHAAAMASWLVLFATQTYWLSSGRVDVHRRLGKVSFLLAPVMLFAMVGLVAMRADVLAAIPSDLGEVAIARTRQDLANLTLINTGSIVLFPLFYLWAMVARARNPETHKRMMVLATLVLMSPATGRLVGVTQVLPDLGLNGADARHVYQLLLIVPALAYDVLRRGRPHRAYVAGLSLMLAYMIAAHFLWDSPAWAAFVL